VGEAAIGRRGDGVNFESVQIGNQQNLQIIEPQSHLYLERRRHFLPDCVSRQGTLNTKGICTLNAEGI
jgi:hypothetical protein